MLLHPLLLALMVTDVVGALLVLAAGVKAFKIVTGWDPSTFDRKQLQLEIDLESFSLLGYWILGLLLFSTFLFILGITNVLPCVVPGAMCGTGVMQALGEAGSRGLFLRLLALAVLFLWLAVQRINFSRPEAPLTKMSARLLLVALPVYYPALYETFHAVLNINLPQPVSCCAVVYDQFRSLEEARSTAGLPDSVWLTGFIIGALALIISCVLVFRSRSRPKGPGAVWLALISGLWVPVAAVTLVRILAAYHYGVLQHHCPWCLFLAEYRLVGFPLYGALTVVAFETLIVLFLPRLTGSVTDLRPAVEHRIRSACLLIAGSAIVFVLLAALPALYWRLRFGMWL